MPAVPPSNAANTFPSGVRDVRRLGEGAEGGTWVGIDSGGRKVVLKHVAAERGRMLQRMASVLASVSSPHLPDLEELRLDANGGGWLITQYVEGTPLEAGPAPISDVLDEAIGVGRALAALHRLGTHHGDPSLQNVLRTPTGGIVLTDLGQVGALGCGTPGYLAPEVLSGGGGPAADRFALGSLLWARAYGEPPFQKPQELVSLTPSRVSARLRGSSRNRGPVEESLMRVVQSLLHPDPDRRPDTTDAVVQHLVRLRTLVSEHAGDPGARAVFHIPRRFAHVGPPFPSLDPDVRLVLVSGPPRSGRRRLLSERILSLQAAGHRARCLDHEQALAALDAPDAPSLFGAWIDSASRRGGRQVIGLLDPLELPDSPDSARARAAVLAAAAEIAGDVLVSLVDTDVAREFLSNPHKNVLVMRVRPLAVEAVAQLLGEVMENGDVAHWAEVVHEVTGGWPARVVNVIRAAATLGLGTPDPKALADALGRNQAELGPELAQAVLARAWGGRGPNLPPELGGAGQPPRWALEAARQHAGDHLRPMAEAQLRALRALAEPIPVALALDSDDSDTIEALVVTAASPTPELLQRIVEAPERFGSAARAATARWMLRWGRAAEAKLAVRGLESPEMTTLEARAELRLGSPEATRRALDRATAAGEVGLGTKLLAWVRLGDGPKAVEEFERAVARGEPQADAYLWAGYAAMLAGDERATTWLASAHSGTPEIRARAAQLEAHRALATGDLLAATGHLEEARRQFLAEGDRVGARSAHGSLAAVALSRGHFSRGVSLARETVRQQLAAGEWSQLPAATFNLAKALGCVGNEVEAQTVVKRSRRVIEGACSAVPDEARAWLALALAEGGHSVEPSAFEGACEAFAAVGRRDMAADACLVGARRLLAASPDPDLEAAERLIRRAREVLDLGARRCAQWTTAIGFEVAVDLAASELALALHRGRGIADAVETLSTVADRRELLSLGQRLRGLDYDQLVAQALSILAKTHTDSRPQLEPLALASRASADETLRDIMEDNSALDRPGVAETLAKQTVARIGGALEDVAVPQGQPAVPAADASDKSRLLIRLYRRLAREDSLERCLEQVVDAMMELTGAERGLVALNADHGSTEVQREIGSQQDMVVSRSILRQVLDSGEPVLSVDAAADDRFDASRSVSHLNLRSVLAVPLRFRGEVLGAAYVDHRLRRGAFTQAQLEQVEDFADLAALAVAHARALDSVREQTSALQARGQEMAQLIESQRTEVETLREEVRAMPERKVYRGMVGASPKMQQIFRLIDRVGDTTVPVVIYGESGTGKELVARAVHSAGGRKDRPFIAENCGAIPETLLESVLFGHARGAFTGAQQAKAGLFEAAHGGTIFLDEVGEMSPAMQTKLLRVLQEGEVRRVGETKARKIDVRVIAASNRDLDKLVEVGTFRQDLYYRIHVVRIDVPALRSRREDIPLLVSAMLERHRGEHLRVSAAASRALVRYPWPGNVRELENEVQRWVALCESRVLPEDLSPAIERTKDGPLDDPDDLRIKPRVERMERDLIAQALERTNNNQTQAAQLLGLSRFGLQKKLKRMEEEAREKAAADNQVGDSGQDDWQEAPQ